MKTTVTTPLIEKGTVIALNTIIPFEKVELSIALDNGYSGQREIHRNNFRVYEKITDKDITKEVLGCNDNHAYDGYELINILQKVASYEKSIAEKEKNDSANEVEKWWNGLTQFQKNECARETFNEYWRNVNTYVYEDIEKMYENNKLTK
jgi:hypothetical protein